VKKTLVLFVFMMVIIPNLYGQEPLQVNLSGIQIGEKILNQTEWKNLTIPSEVPIHVSFNTIGNIKGQVFYRVFLDAKIIYPRLLDNYFSIEKSNLGNHIIKIVPYTSGGVEGSSLTFAYKVEDVNTTETIAEIEPEPTNSTSSVNLFSNPLTVFILIGIVAIQLILIIFLFLRRKSSQSNEVKTVVKIQKEISKKESNQNEANAIKENLSNIKLELEQTKEENEILRKNIKELDSSIQNLENSNVQLVEQKEKLTESKHKLELLQIQKEELFAMAIHDIKNPASAIRGYIELLNSYDLNAQEQQDIMLSLVASSEEVIKLSQDMCTLIAKAMPEPKLKFSASSLKVVIDSVCAQNATYAKAKTVKLINNTQDNLPSVNMDTEKISEALDNFINNAIKYAPAETKVEVRSYVKEENKKYAVVEVEDTGVGLSDDDIKKAFQKGVILSSKPTGFEQSSGLGLWIVKRIIEEHDGRVWVKSQIGKGSTFAFELPVSE
jgi:signal transduction histidine kinase